jgi:hypothetical protein
MAVWCDYCDRGSVQVEGWHVFIDDEPTGTSYRVPCAIFPPTVETVETEL